MRILVCVKRVPAPGARIVLTDDGQAIDTNMLSFAVSPHEECAVEEAVQLAESNEGTATVLTLGPPEAEEQLRAALAVGASEAVLVPTDGSDWDPISTAEALASTIAELEEEGQFDLILFGNESADSGGYQVGIRVAHTLGRPMVSGIKGIDVEDGSVKLRRETNAGSEIYQLPLPAVVAVKEGINLPRYPTLKGRLNAKKVDVQQISQERTGSGQNMLRLVTPVQEISETTILDDATAVVDVLEELQAVKP
ncbi:MAG: electron transfer flavoprotein subunit beta/FixA family protein [Acidimicrobiia bacterium]|jgi:electron transfer flavoprotein beta subunit